MSKIHTLILCFPEIHLILSSYLCLGLPHNLFPSEFPPDIPCTLLICVSKVLLISSSFIWSTWLHFHYYYLAAFTFHNTKQIFYFSQHIKNGQLQNLKFLKQCCWRYVLVLLRCDIIPLREWFAPLGTTHWTARHHIPDDINPWMHCSLWSKNVNGKFRNTVGCSLLGPMKERGKRPLQK